MGKKIWVIDTPQEKPVTGAALTRGTASSVAKRETKARNPALSYSLSLLVWGCGQCYNKQWKEGILFLLLMGNFCLFLGVVVRNPELIVSASESGYVSATGRFLIFCFLYSSGIIAWLLNAIQAYFKSVRIDAAPFKGVNSKPLPAICSLLMPGWGQFLNGQTKKGLCFQLFAMAGLITFPLIVIVAAVWPILEASAARTIVEWIFTLSIFLTPFIIFMWFFSIFDAARISMNTMKKEPLPKRVTYAMKRFRQNVLVYGWKNAFIPVMKRNILFVLLLIICGISYEYVPREYYMTELQSLEQRLSDQEMTLLPGFIRKVVNIVMERG